MNSIFREDNGSSLGSGSLFNDNPFQESHQKGLFGQENDIEKQKKPNNIQQNKVQPLGLVEGLFDSVDDESVAIEEFDKNKRDSQKKSNQHQKAKSMFGDDDEEDRDARKGGIFFDDYDSFPDHRPRVNSLTGRLVKLFNDDEPDLIKEPENKRLFSDDDGDETPPGERIPFNQMNSFDLSNTDFEWIKMKLKELGLKVRTYQIIKAVNQHPPGTLKDFILEALVQNYYDGNLDEEQENEPQHLTPVQIAPVSPSRSIFSEPPAYVTRFFCYGCYQSQPGVSLDYRVWNCVHTQCRDCLLKIYQNMPNKSELPQLSCPFSADCRNPIQLNKFYELVPEAEAELFGLTGEEDVPCDICFETVKGPKELLQIFNCNQHFYCYPCTKTHIKEHLENFKVLKLKCPQEDCGAAVNEEKMQQIISIQLFEKYTRFKNNALVERNPNLKWCSRPGCEQIVPKPQNETKAVCKCGQETCFECGNEWHKGKTCEQAMKDLYKFYAKKNDIQICPECKSRVEKAEGCNHMTCLVCTYEWCWLCKGEYSRNHYDPFNPLGCPGLMSGHNTRKKWSKCKLYGYRFLIFLGILLAIATSPIWVIGVAIMFPNIVYTPHYNRGKCDVCVRRTLLFIIGLICFPLTLVLGIIAAIVPGSCYLMAYIFKFFKTKRENKRRRRRLIKERKEREKQNDLENPVQNLRIPLIDDDEEFLQPGILYPENP